MKVDRLIERLEKLRKQNVGLDVLLEAAVRGVNELSPRFHTV